LATVSGGKNVTEINSVITESITYTTELINSDAMTTPMFTAWLISW